MIRLNRRIKLKTGEIVTPYLIDGDVVSCFDRKGNTLYKELKDFLFNTKIKKRKSNILVVSGYSPIVKEESLFETNISGGLGGAYEERKQAVKIIPKETVPEAAKEITEVESSTMDEIPIEPSSGIKQDTIPEIDIENKTKTSGNGDSTFEIKKNDEDLYDDLYGDF